MFEGFFSKEQTTSSSRPDGRTYSCASCGLYRNVLHPRMPSFGEGKKDIMIIGEAPGEDEDRRGKQWQGKMGRALQKIYKDVGIDLFTDCVNINAINCRPTDKKGNNRAPTGYEVVCCRQRVLKTIREKQPKVIILHGGTAVESVIGCKWKKELGGVMKWRGWTIPDRDFQAWVCPTLHPSFVERQKGYDEVYNIWLQDIRRAVSMTNIPVPVYEAEEQLVEIGEAEPILRELENEILSKIENRERPLLAFDIETTSLKPYDTTVQDIACISFCIDDSKAYVIPSPRTKREKALFKLLMTNPKVGKIAHNMKFEDTWLNVLYGIEVSPWEWDTMQAAHVLDNRKYITSLKFQSFVNFGLAGYDDDVSQYLKGGDRPSETNKVMEAMKNKVTRDRIMTYCGIDSLMTYRLAQKQREEIL